MITPHGQLFKHYGLLLGRGLTALVFPDKCLKCGIYIQQDPELALSSCYCPACLGNLPLFESPFCPCCGLIFSSRTGEDHLCESCMKKAPVLDTVKAVFEYKDVIREAIALFKYQARLSLAKPFEHYLYEAFDTWFAGDPIHMICPIPLHRKKAVKRGYNQSYLLVRRFRGLYQKQYRSPPPWSLDFRSLKRIRHTPSQTGLDVNAREKNLKRAFVWQSNRNLEGKSVLLVDDVYTTGSTCNSAARALKDVGAAQVSALVLARA